METVESIRARIAAMPRVTEEDSHAEAKAEARAERRYQKEIQK